MTEGATASRIRKMAQELHVAYVRTPRDVQAHHITRLAGDDVEFDEIERLLIEDISAVQHLPGLATCEPHGGGDHKGDGGVADESSVRLEIPSLQRHLP